MCPSCKFWTALQVLWSTVYVTCGAAQLVAGIFFMISVPELQLTSNLWAGSWDVIIGITGGILTCFGRLSPRRQEFLLYMAISVLAVNCVHVILSEWGLYQADMPKVIQQHPNHMLIDYACFATRITTAAVILVSFLDSQFSFCSMQLTKSPQGKKKLRGSHEQVSDIEYIIPRAKSSKPHTVYDAYSQSWVFDTDGAGTSKHTEPYIKIVQNGTPKSRTKKANGMQNGILSDTTHLIDNPVVHIEEASDDSTSNSDRKLCHMKSFSRSTSPVVLSASSSQISLNLNQPAHSAPIYECLEKLTEPTIYRSRLNTALSNKDEDDGEEHYHPPQAIMMRRVESVSPHAEKVQYASLMKELQRAIVNKKEPSVISPQSTSDSVTTSDKTQTNSKSSSRHDSSRSEAKSSDAEFSKELEAALQLIQDLESPNTIDTPSEPKSSLEGKDPRPLAVWRNSDASGSEKTLSAVGSLGEITSPLTECQPELYTFKPPPDGKGASVIVHFPDSQSTSGYSSPSHASNALTPSWSTTSSINGSNNDIVKPLSYSIHNAKSTTVISLYTQNSLQSKGKSVTLVTITGDTSPVNLKPAEPVHSSTLIDEFDMSSHKNSMSKDTDTRPNKNEQKNLPKRSLSSVSQSGVWNVKSLLRKKKPIVPRLCPELEEAIIKSESLAYLSELELLARHQRNKDIQREIEERVIQQLGTPRTESNC